MNAFNRVTLTAEAILADAASSSLIRAATFAIWSAIS